jgi:PadR family transcriptional regulator, regulatory protein AphA
MSLRHAVLGLLAMEPSSGYELARRFDRSLAYAWHAGHSQIYPELARLEDAGLVEVVATGARNRKTYDLTPDGHDELRHWLLEIEPQRTVRDEMLLRGFLQFLLAPGDLRALLEREARILDHQADAYRQIYAEMGTNARFRPVLDLGIRMNAVLREWIGEQIAGLGPGGSEEAARR